MRGFVAFGLAEGISAELFAAVKELEAQPGLSLLHSADYHVTLKFLSEFSSERFFQCLPELCALGPPPRDSLVAKQITHWPTVLALECEASPELERWQRELNELLEKNGFLKERHPKFRPHVTLARRKPETKLPALGVWLEKNSGAFEGRGLGIRHAALWRSRAPETGRRHEELLCPLFSTS